MIFINVFPILEKRAGRQANRLFGFGRSGFGVCCFLGVEVTRFIYAGGSRKTQTRHNPKAMKTAFAPVLDAMEKLQTAFSFVESQFRKN